MKVISETIILFTIYSAAACFPFTFLSLMSLALALYSLGTCCTKSLINSYY